MTDLSTDMEHFFTEMALLPTGVSTPTPRRNLAAVHFVDERINPILKKMEEGFQVDAHALMNLKRSHELILIDLNADIQGRLVTSLSINSNGDLGNLLFNNLNLPSLRSTPTGKPCVSVDVLERLCNSYPDAHPLLESIIEFKKVQSSVKSVKTILKKLDLQGRIHPEFNHSTCTTGRIYSYIQNLPKDVRKVLIPDKEGNVFIELDWSQQELRILAALSQEPMFLDCFARGEDLHQMVISEIFHKPISEVTDEERKTGKTINYALIYGQEAPGLGWKLNIPLEEAKELIDQYFLSLPRIQKFKNELREKFLREGCAETIFGRNTHLELTGPKKEKELRRGFNHIIQGTSADILRMTLIRLNEALAGGKAKLKFCAHDAIYLEAEKESAKDVEELAKSIMEIDFMGVRLPVTIKIHHDFSMGEGAH